MPRQCAGLKWYVLEGASGNCVAEETCSIRSTNSFYRLVGIET